MSTYIVKKILYVIKICKNKFFVITNVKFVFYIILFRNYTQGGKCDFLVVFLSYCGLSLPLLSTYSTAVFLPFD